MQTIATSKYQLLRELSTTRPKTSYVDNPFTDQLEQAGWARDLDNGYYEKQPLCIPIMRTTQREKYLLYWSRA
jgi:hypothetical protein